MSGDFNNQHKVETYKSLITISLEIFKYLILLNGGAAAGILAGVDKIVKVIDASAVRSTMIWFVIGLVAATAAVFTAYFTQSRLHDENIGLKKHGGHEWYVLAAVFLCIASLICFCAGALTAVLNIKAQFPV